MSESSHAAAGGPMGAAVPARQAVQTPTPPRLWPGWPPIALRTMWAQQRAAAPTTAVWVAGLGCGLGAAVLVVGHDVGLGLAVVGVAMWGVGAHSLWRHRRLVDLAMAGVCPPLLAVPAVRDADWLNALCLVAAAAVLGVAVTGARTSRGLWLAPLALAGTVAKAGPWLSRGAAQRAGSRRGQVVALARSMAVTAAVLLVFGALFASADKVFASYLPRPDVGMLPGRVVAFVAAAVVAAALWQMAAVPPRWPVGVRGGRGGGRTARLSEWLLPVLSLDALVAAFVLVQVGALVGGDTHVRRTAGLTYAQYTREGFAQLVAATALTLVVFVVAVRRAPTATSRERVLVRAALGLLCVATLGVVASALRRMDLYVDAFGLTRLRLLATTGEVAMGVILVVALGCLLTLGLSTGFSTGLSTAWLPRAVVLIGAAAMISLAAVNPDAQIARHNTAASERVAIDVSYLQGLSADAVPVIAGLPEPLRSRVLEHATWGHARGSHDRAGVLDRIAGWNLGRARARDTLGSRNSMCGAEGSPVVGGCDPDLLAKVVAQ